MSQTNTKVLTAHVPFSLAKKVDDMAEKLERSRGWIIKQALNDWIKQEEERDKLTREALIDVDLDNVIDNDTVQTWAQSLNTDNQLPKPI